MRLFDGGRVPNARRVRIFLAEKGIDVPKVPVDLGKMDHRTPEFTARNPLQRVPVLELVERVVVLKEGMLVMDAPKAQALNNSRMQQQQQQAATGREWKNENQSA